MTTPVVCIVQARLGSSRLPGKVLKELLGKPMLERQLERMKHARSLDEIVVATTDLPEDRAILELAVRCGVPAFAGSEKDVLDRYYRAASLRRAAVVVRCTGDCPVIDPTIIDEVVALFRKGGADYATQGTKCYPTGLDVEAFSFRSLETAWKEARLPSEREHVTPFLWKNPERFRPATLAPDFDHSALRLSVDHPADFELIRTIYERLYRPEEPFLFRDIVELFAREPALPRLNAGIHRHEGYIRSLSEEGS